MTKFQLTLYSIVSRDIEIEAKDYDEAFAELVRQYRNGEIDDTCGWVRVEVSDGNGEHGWETVAEYYRR